MPSLGRGERRPLARENNAPLSYWVSSWLWLLRAVAERKIGARRDPATQCWNGWGAPRRGPPRTRCGQMTADFPPSPRPKIRLSCPVTAAANVPAEMNNAVIVLIDPSAGHEPFGQSLDVHYQLPLRAPPDCFYDVPGSPLSAAASGAARQHDGGAAARHCANGNRHARRDRGWRQSDRRAPEHPSPSGRRSRPMSRAPRPCISPAALPAPEPFLVFFPTADGEPIDNWDLAGLRGTGSHDYAVSGLFAISPRLVVCRTNSRISSYSSACVSRRGSSGIQSLRKFIEPKAYKNT